MTPLQDVARAKVNLTLKVLGRRPDGYHELESLVVFADVGDRLELEPAADLALAIEGPFAAALDGDNLVLAAAEAAMDAVPGLQAGRFRLVKHLPVAAGLGGGSADAAAALRLLRRANPGSALDLSDLALRLGADVPACLRSEAALVRGIGERIEPVASLAALPVVLVNPGLPLSTRDVFRELGAEPIGGTCEGPAAEAALDDREALLDHLRGIPNDLEAPALRLLPEIASVKAELMRRGAEMARLSGSGATCFGVFATAEAARTAAAAIAAAHSGWWVTATILR